MRAGSLSDARVVALLTKYFVNVRMPELSTENLIRDPRDVALLRGLHERSVARGGAGFHAGEREAFLSPAGELLDCITSLGSLNTENQHSRASRARPDGAVKRFFAAAAKVLERVGGARPDDLDTLLAGTAPEVAAVRKRRPPEPAVPAGHLALRVSVRNDRLMYDGLCGDELWFLPHAAAAGLLPADPAAGSRAAWPRDLFLELAHRAYPRGHVVPRLDAESITGGITTIVDHAGVAELRGRFTGELTLAPTRRAELGPRPSARVPFRCVARVEGDFAFDRATGRFTALRLASVASELEHVTPIGDYGKEDYVLGVGLVGAGL